MTILYCFIVGNKSLFPFLEIILDTFMKIPNNPVAIIS